MNFLNNQYSSHLKSNGKSALIIAKNKPNMFDTHWHKITNIEYSCRKMFYLKIEISVLRKCFTKYIIFHLGLTSSRKDIKVV